MAGSECAHEVRAEPSVPRPLQRVVERLLILGPSLSEGREGCTITGMTNPGKKVLAEALRLDLDERAELASEILASLDGPADPDAEAAWQAEVERRVAAIESGVAHLETWDDVKRRIEKEILGR